MNVKYTVAKNESASKKKKLMEDAVKSIGTKLKIANDTFEIPSSDESKLVSLLTKSGVRYNKG